MKLTFEQIKDITKGAVRIEEIEGRVNFFRFTKEQENMYAEANKVEKIASLLPNVTVIDCFDFIPHEATMFSPDVLHPNFLGFSYYADGVTEAIKKECGIE